MTVPLSFVFLRGQIQFMRSRGFEIILISSPGDLLTKFRDELRVASYGVPMQRRISPIADLIAIARLVIHLQTVKPTIVHAHTPKAGLLGMVAAVLARRPVRIYHMRGLPLLGSTGVKRALLTLAEFVACRLAHRVLCVSESVRQVAIQKRLVLPSKIVVLANGSGNGVDAQTRFNKERLDPGTRDRTRARCTAGEQEIVIGYVGRLVRDKGIVELSAAWGIVRAKDERLRLLLVGPFEDEDAVPNDTKAVLLNDPRVTWVGFEWDTPPLYAAMDMFVLPTYREGFPNGVLEASAMELPVVATNVPGCIDAVVPGETGTLVPPGQIEPLASALLEYANDAERRRREGAAGRRRVLTLFRPESIWGALQKEYQCLLGASSPAARPH